MSAFYLFIYLSIHIQVDHLHVQVRPAVPVREAGQDKQDGGPRAGGADRGNADTIDISTLYLISNIYQYLGAADTRYIYLVPII